MKTEHILITVHFLECLRKQHEESEKLAPIHPAFAHLLDKEELMAIMQQIYNGDTEFEHPNFEDKSREELCVIIKDEYYILEYLIDEVFGRRLLS